MRDLLGQDYIALGFSIELYLPRIINRKTVLAINHFSIYSLAILAQCMTSQESVWSSTCGLLPVCRWPISIEIRLSGLPHAGRFSSDPEINADRSMNSNPNSTKDMISIILCRSCITMASAVADRRALKELDTKFASTASSGAQKRLLQELKALRKTNTRPEGFELEIVNDDLTLWEAKIWCETTCSLGKDLAKFKKYHGRDYVTMRLRFGSDYPNQPPFAWIVSPIFEPQTGFVSRGAVCTTMLLNTGTSAAWSKTYNAEAIVRQIRANFHLPDARGRIASINYDQSYTEHQARAGWVHAKSMHGW